MMSFHIIADQKARRQKKKSEELWQNIFVLNLNLSAAVWQKQITDHWLKQITEPPLAETNYWP